MDVVYIVRQGEQNGELRYSLRSLQNLPHDRVWIAGYCPSFVRNVGKITVLPHPNKYRSAEANLRAACEHPEVSESFYLFNDDFYVMQPMEYVPVLHRGKLSGLIAHYLQFTTALYVKGMQQIEHLIHEKGIAANPLSYEMHCPLPIEKQKMLEVLDMRGSIDCFHLRTLYGNLHSLGGRYSEDVKVYKSDKSSIASWEKMPLVSTSDMMFRHHKVGRWIMETLSTPSTYEHRTRAHVSVY